MKDRDPLGLVFIDAYIGVFVDTWHCELDHEDGSTAPFSYLAAAQAEGVADELALCLAIELE
jgi:hypothetical protein